MRSLLTILVLLLCSAPLISGDTEAVNNAAQQYAKAWYEADSSGMAAVIHPGFIKRLIGWNKIYNQNGNLLQQMNAPQFLSEVKSGMGKRVSPDERQSKITVYEIYSNSASIKLELTDRFEYMHLSRWNGQWKIFNVLWEMKPQD